MERLLVFPELVAPVLLLLCVKSSSCGSLFFPVKVNEITYENKSQIFSSITEKKITLITLPDHPQLAQKEFLTDEELDSLAVQEL